MSCQSGQSKYSFLKISMLYSRFTFLALVLIFSSPPFLLAQSPAKVDILQNSRRTLKLRWQTAQDSIPALLAKTKASAQRQQDRKPLIHSELLILPPAGTASLRVSSPAAEISGNFPVHDTENLPQAHAELLESGWWRGFRLARLHLSPIIRDPAGQIQVARTIDIQINFPQVALPAPARSVREAERKVLKTTLNGEQARWWRDFYMQKNQTQFDRERMQRPFFRIGIRETGMYRIDFQDLQAAGGLPETMNPHQFQLFYRGTEQPVFFLGDADSLFESDEQIWFFGERLAGENGEWYHDETDVNVYQLRQNNSRGLRFQIRQVNDDPAKSPVPVFLQKKHFETDLRYYHGDNDADIFTTAKIPGEGWMWHVLSGTQSFTTNLDLPGATAGAPACSLRARIRGITRDAIKPNHHVQIFLNGQIVADTRFSDTAEIILRTAFPASLLRDGNNEFRIFSAGDTGAFIDQFYFDWVEIDYWRNFETQGKQLVFQSPQENGSQPQRFRMAGFPDEEIFIFDLSNTEMLSGLSVAEDGGGGFMASFIDSSRQAQQYLAATKSTLKKPHRISHITPSSWRDPGHRADMIIVTHADFAAQAHRLAEHRRQKNGFAVAVVDVQEIYDEFYYGLQLAQAIREFLQYAFRNWQQPAPLYVLFMGDGSWDPKGNDPKTTKRSFVPTIGNPVSDNRLVCFDGPDDFIPDMFSGRIAVETPEQAEVIVDKIIAYESMPLQDWAKDFTFLNGGINAFEHNLFFQQSEKLIRNYVESPPVFGKPTRIYKASEGRIAGELLPDILSAIDTGVSIFAFSGHAGSQTWELMMVNEDIPRLRNFDKLPFIASMTCHTARFAEPAQNSFGEEFLRLPDRGAVAFWSTSGWGFVFQDGVLLEGLFRAITQDSVRSVGVATTTAKIGLWQQYGDFQTNINLIDQYTLLGDPALTLALPVQPDLAFENKAFSTVPETPTERDSLLQIDVALRNRGLGTIDSTEIVLQVRAAEKTGIDLQQKVKIGPVGYADTVAFAWPGRDRRGEYVVEAEIDPADVIREQNEQNNRAQGRINFFSANLAIATPRMMEVMPENRPRLFVYNPEVASATPRKYVFEIDTTSDFDSPFLLTSGAIDEQPVRTGWLVTAPIADGRYDWRVRTEENGLPGAWVVSSFFVDAKNGSAGFLQREQDWRNISGVYAFSDSGATLPWNETAQKFETTGEIFSPAIGPAQSWKNFSVTQNVRHLRPAAGAAGATARYTIRGRRRANEAWQAIKTDVRDQTALADIDANQFPFLQLQAGLQDDDGLDSPVIVSWRVDFEPLGDLILSRRFVAVTADSLLPGESFEIEANVFYFGKNKPDSATVALKMADKQTALAQGKIALAENGAAVARLQWQGEKPGSYEILVEVDPDDAIPEQFEFNNRAELRLHIREDKIPPRLEITFDGQEIVESPTFVASRPEIICHIFDENPLAIQDTGHVSIFIDASRVFYGDPVAQPQLELLSGSEKRAQVRFYPELAAGEHTITFLVNDAFGNRAVKSALVKVSADFELLEVLNYPNPFDRETEFTFTLTQPADEIRLKIYTVAGRLIQTIESFAANAGFNRLRWDGRDADGDEIANGIYLYKVIARQGEKQVERIEKLAVAR
jgi:hypothetical protein